MCVCVCVYVCVSELPTYRRATGGVSDKGVLDLPPRHCRVGDKVLWPVDLGLIPPRHLVVVLVVF